MTLIGPAGAQESCTTYNFDPPNGVTLLDIANSSTLRPDRATLTSNGLDIFPYDGPSGRNNSHPDVSSNGNLVAWVTQALNVVVGKRNTGNELQIYVRNRSGSSTSFVSFDTVGMVPGNGDSNFPRIADDHRIFYESKASNLVASDTNGRTDVFEFDVNTGSTVLLSRRVDNSFLGNHNSAGPAPSDTGRWVAFVSTATNLVSFVPGLSQQGQTPSNPLTDCGTFTPSGNFGQIFVLDRGSGFDTGNPVSQWTYGPSLAMISVGRDSSGNCVEPHDLMTDGVTVDITDDRDNENASSQKPDMSANGCRVVFESAANNLIAGENITYAQIYLWERDTGQVSLVSRSLVSQGPGNPLAPGNHKSQEPAISDDGRWVVFRSHASNFNSPGDPNDDPEVFVVDLDVRPFDAVKVNFGVNSTQPVSTYPSGGFRGPYISPNGRWITLSCNIPEYIDFPTSVNLNLFDSLIHDRDGNGDGTWGDVLTQYIHLRDPAIAGAAPYADHSTVPFIRFARPQGPPGSQYQEMISTTEAGDLNQSLSPADTNSSVNCTLGSPHCGDDIYVRRVWEQ